MKCLKELNGFAVRWLVVTPMVLSAVGVCLADTSGMFRGGSGDGYDRSEVAWVTIFVPGPSRFVGGSYDGYGSLTGPLGMPPSKGTLFIVN
jgi:hypothetical protein